MKTRMNRLRTISWSFLAVSALACTTDAGYDPPFASTDAATDSSGGAMASTGVETGASSEGAEDPGPDPDTTGSTTGDDEGGALCGDGVVSGSEECDCAGRPCREEQLGGTTCVDVDDPFTGPLTGGTLSCNPASCRFDTSMCSSCGDGRVNGNEVCDGELLAPVSCRELGRGTAGEVACGADCQLDTSACTACGYGFDFSTCDGWTVGRTDPLAAVPSWACGDPTGDPPYGPPGAFTGAWGTSLTGFYSANESSFLRSPPLDFGRCAGERLTLTLSHWFNFESLVENADGGIVQVSTDGDTWTTLEPTGGTQYGDEPIIATFPPVDGALGFDGSIGDDDSASVLDSVFDLSAYAGETDVYVRFVFGSNESSVTAGWYIDAVEILGSGGG
jgi:hypothetical protein